MNWAWRLTPRTGLEMTLLRMLAFRPVSAEAGEFLVAGPLKVDKPVVSNARQPVRKPKRLLPGL